MSCFTSPFINQSLSTIPSSCTLSFSHPKSLLAPPRWDAFSPALYTCCYSLATSHHLQANSLSLQFSALSLSLSIKAFVPAPHTSHPHTPSRAVDWLGNYSKETRVGSIRLFCEGCSYEMMQYRQKPKQCQNS